MPQDGRGSHWSRLLDLVRRRQAPPGGDAARPGGYFVLLWGRRVLGATAGAVRRLPATILGLLKHVAHAFPDWVDHLRKVTTGIALVGGIGVGTWIIVDLSANEPLVFDDIHVHGSLASQLPSGKRLAGRVSTHFDQLTASIERLREQNDSALKPDAELPNLEIPGAQVSVQAVVEVVRRFLGLRERRIGGDIFVSDVPLAPPPGSAVLAGGAGCPAERSVYVVVRLSTSRSELAEPVEARVCAVKSADGRSDSIAVSPHLVESLLQLAALRAYEHVNPCGSAAYYFHNWYRRSLDGRVLDADFRRTNAMISTCLSTGSEVEAVHANHLFGRIRQASGRSREALDYFEAAELLHWRAQSWWRKALHSWGWRQVTIPQDLYGHWGSALLDVDNPRAALWKFFEQVSHQPESTLGYVGMGNALAQLAKKDARMLGPALDIYCHGARRLRQDAEIRHVLANFLEANHSALGRCPERTPDEVNVASSQGTRIPIRLRDNPALAYAFRQRLKTVDLMPTEPRYGLALGQSLRRAGDNDGAIAAFNRVLRFSQHLSWQAYSELASTYLAMGRRAEAEETYRRALFALTHLAGQRPFDEEVRSYAALASLQLKDNAEAVRWAREALVREPTLQVARFTLACAEWRRGDKVAARAQLAAARMLDNGDDGLMYVDAFLRECVTGIDHLASEGSQ